MFYHGCVIALWSSLAGAQPVVQMSSQADCLSQTQLASQWDETAVLKGHLSVAQLIEIG
jgi:hypothetical protein